MGRDRQERQVHRGNALNSFEKEGGVEVGSTGRHLDVDDFERVDVDSRPHIDFLVLDLHPSFVDAITPCLSGSASNKSAI